MIKIKYLGNGLWLMSQLKKPSDDAFCIVKTYNLIEHKTLTGTRYEALYIEHEGTKLNCLKFAQSFELYLKRNNLAMAMINSLKCLAEVKIVKESSYDDVVVDFDGFLFSAIYNQFSGTYYVDDIYGLRAAI